LAGWDFICVVIEQCALFFLDVRLIEWLLDGVAEPRWVVSSRLGCVDVDRQLPFVRCVG